MDQHLRKYLVLHRNLSIPQTGSFLIKTEPARVDPTGKLLYAPRSIVYFTDGIVPMSEKIFFDFLAAEMGVDELTAIKHFHDFSYALRNRLADKQEVVLDGIGTLAKKEDDTIVFTAEKNITELNPPVEIKGGLVISTKESSYEYTEEVIEETTTDRWLFFAIILFILGLGALAYYYL